jgi:hypothetical protein
MIRLPAAPGLQGVQSGYEKKNREKESGKKKAGRQ